MEGLADFLDSLIGGVELSVFSLTLGSILWGMVVLRPWQSPTEYPEILLQKTIKLMVVGAFALFITQLAKIALQVWLMAVTLNMWPFPAFADTMQFQAGLWRGFFALLLALYCFLYLKKKPFSQQHWQMTGILSIPLIFAGAWLVHAAGRFEDRAYLMSLTVLHQMAAAAWIGGILQLVNLWLLHQKGLIKTMLWPTLLSRFSKLGMLAVAILLLSGVPIAFEYINTWNGFIGTGYGNLLLVKIMLLSIALGFAYLNRSAVADFQSSGSNNALYDRVPYYVEAETFVLISILFTAASLAAQPPAIDIPDLTANWQEVLNTFSPRFPRISSPTHESLIAGEAGRIAIIGQTPSEAATAWSDYNHNISGLFLLVMSIFAMLSYDKDLPLTRYWPIGFVLLGIFLFFRSDAETWPLGPLGFWESTFTNGEVLQHRIATLLVFVLGMMEIKARMTDNPNSKLAYIFPFLSAFGGLMLLTHSHIGFQAKSAFLIQVGHTLMGIFALILACGRWLELKLDKPGSSIAGFTSVFALFQISLILLFYREPLY